ncbi:hypothetical protein [Ferribacterium limneticum]|uniref:hypothetical protein n=1 Tax=Ferribacterium limneticum TaxID=76259 RepID=UPI001CFB18F5|nr:hypothetical protein [Ferribacterium limneticum]UCV27899.1 hypothetical protein KI617_16890 [Ferribacterium limneticum]UCV31816.1 hypothetical protein KI608_16890 [Ferribacterium limneticum]
MPKITLALLFAAGALIAGCKSNETKPEETAPAPTAAAAPEPAPAAKPVCPPEPTAKKKTTSKSKTAKKADTPPADCEPAKPKATTSTKAAEPAKPEPAAAAVAGSTAGKACNPCAMKSKDGTFEGEVYGTIPPGSKWSRLQIGMHQSEVERILGVTSNIRAYVTAKAWIPFYFGGDSHRYEAVYAGQGSVAYTGGSFGGGQGILMMINYDPKIQ